VAAVVDSAVAAVAERAAEEVRAAVEVVAGADGEFGEIHFSMEDSVTPRHDYRQFRVPMFLAALVLAVTSVGDLNAGEARRPQTTVRTFATPTEGFMALVDAARSNDVPAIEAILGPGSRDVVESGDPVADKLSLDNFLAAYDMKSNIVSTSTRTSALQIGDDNWELPIPLVQQNGRWHFDLAAGRDEIVNRRIGRNELNAIQASLAFVDAQRDYASEDRTGDGILKYAQHFISTPGTKDGLYWPTADDQPPSPLGEIFAEASGDAYLAVASNVQPSTRPMPTPYYGYYYKILTSQGPSAPGGAYDYIVKGDMLGGFAMIAYPDDYDVSGVMTFMVNHEGVVYQKDLGPDTGDLAEEIKSFNPDNTWQRVQPPPN